MVVADDVNKILTARVSYSGQSGYKDSAATAAAAATVPAAPGNFTATPGNKQVVLTWTTPDNGGSSIGRYNISYGETEVYTEDWSLMGKANASTVTYTVTGLKNEMHYTFEIRALNTVGDGVSSGTIVAMPSANETEIAAVFQRTVIYHRFELLVPTVNYDYEDADLPMTVGTDNIIFPLGPMGATTYTLSNLSTRGGGTFGAGYTWAYLYQNDIKIGIILFDGTYEEICTGKYLKETNFSGSVGKEYFENRLGGITLDFTGIPDYPNLYFF